MSIDLPNTPEKHFAAILRSLIWAVAAMSGGDRLSFPLIALITNRIMRAKQRFSSLAARILAGRYVPRPRSAAPQRKPPPPNPLPRKSGWLLPLVPDAVGYRSHLDRLFRDPRMAALMAAAPEPMGRALRPLCRMLGLSLPDILVPPAKPRPPRKPRPARPKPPPPPPRPPLEMPAWMRIGPDRKPWPLSWMRSSRRG